MGAENDDVPGAHSRWQKHCDTEQDWTIVVSSPPQAQIPSHEFSYGMDCGLVLVTVVQVLLARVITEWGPVIDHIDTLLAEGHSICSPADHDRLLVDDENLTRSRKYFWVMTSIDEFSILLDRTVQALEELYHGHVPPKTEREDKRVGAMVDSMNTSWRSIDKTHKQLIDRCNAYLHRLEEQKRRTDLFRSGVSILIRFMSYDRLTGTFQLFNASSVIESRLSSRLSENVMLLTYVSIFYIPLGFISVSTPWPKR
jgi:hypothetical protein